MSTDSVQPVLDILRTRAEEHDGPLRIVIDGPSGSGKTVLAHKLAGELDRDCPRGVLVLNLEEWIPGWGGLAVGTATAEALLTGQVDQYSQWDWQAKKWTGKSFPDPNKCWIVEGCGTLTPTTAEAATLTVWVETDPHTARRRGLERDGEEYAPFWDQWHAQEQEHWAKHRPQTLADVRVAT